MQFPRSRILIFAKAPVPGAVKTRLIPALGPVAAAELYRELLVNTVSTACASGLAPVDLWCAPDRHSPLFLEMARDWRLDLCDQPAGDLGARMAHAARRALQAADSVLIIGADCPGLGVDQLGTALHGLAGGADAVLGPAEDGGYVLLGLKRYSARLFEEVPWGGARVLETTRERLRALGWVWQELEPLWDLDRPADLERYRALTGRRSCRSNPRGGARRR